MVAFQEDVAKRFPWKPCLKHAVTQPVSTGPTLTTVSPEIWEGSMVSTGPMLTTVSLEMREGSMARLH